MTGSQQDRLRRAREALARAEATSVAAAEASRAEAARGGAPEGRGSATDAPATDAPGRRRGGVVGAAGEGRGSPGERAPRRRGGAERPRRGGRRRAPAQEPPSAGAAAVDAEPDPESVARTIALNQLNHSPRSRAQLAEAMARKDVPDDVAERVLDRFEEVGLVDDAAYAGMLVRTRLSERGLARRALAVELRRKGIDPETAGAALAEVDTDDEEAAARRLVEKRLRAMSGLEPEVRRRRLAGMLARKGYGAGLSYRVINEALGAEAEQAPDLD